jgi:hypothetical protein
VTCAKTGLGQELGGGYGEVADAAAGRVVDGVADGCGGAGDADLADALGAYRVQVRAEAIIWTLAKASSAWNTTAAASPPGYVPASSSACIWFNWLIGAPVKRSLIAYDH